MTTRHDSIDWAFRPETYFPQAQTPEQLLTRIKGQVRRELAQAAFDETGFRGLTEFLARESLPGGELQNWGRVHPMMMGGEYLPDLQAGEVEIARISLASVMGDQICVRARPKGGRIAYSVVDEYETEYHLSQKSSSRPLTLVELVRLLDQSYHSEEPDRGGLIVSHWNYIHEMEGDAESAVAFASIDSVWYPQLGEVYEKRATEWLESLLGPVEYEDECDEVT